METKGVTCKIPLELHNQISEEIRASGSTMSRFIEMVITSYYEEKEKGTVVMEKTRTMTFQISEDLFQKIKEYLAEYERIYHRKLTQKEFVISLVEQALSEAEEEFEAARAVQEEAKSDQQYGYQNEDDTEDIDEPEGDEEDAEDADEPESDEEYAEDADDPENDEKDAGDADEPESDEEDAEDADELEYSEVRESAE